MRSVAIPSNFDWKHYLTLNPYANIPANAEGATRHYGTCGHIYGWAYDWGQLEVLIYSAGKTGSTTLGSSFARSGYKTALLHYDPPNPEIGRIIDIINYPRPHKLLVATTYREPISRYISAFFENITPLLRISQEEFASRDYDWCVSKVIEHLYSIVFKPPNENLFDPALSGNYGGTDILSKPFDKDQGYAMIETDKLQILILRFDKIDNWVQLVNTHAQKKIHLVSTNLTQKKPTGTLYKQISNTIVIPREILDHLFTIEAPTIAHLFADKEIDTIINRWYGRLDVNNSD